jgi:DNA polymerase III epsilon subunit family exonuclease
VPTGTYVVIDLETTGLDPQIEVILEIAAVRLEAGHIVASWQTLVRPPAGVPISAASQAIHGISPEMVAEAPPVEAALIDFLAFLGMAPIVAHNASFDLGFLNKALAAADLPALATESYDTLEMAREVFSDARSHKLEAVCRLLGHEAFSFHRAADDAGHLAAVFPRLLDLWQQKQAWYRAQFSQADQLARRWDQLQKLIDDLQTEQAELRRVLGAYFVEHPDAQIRLPSGDLLARAPKTTWEFDLEALRPHLVAWGMAERLLKLDRQRLDRWLAAGRFDEAQREVLQAARQDGATSWRLTRVAPPQTTPGPGDADVTT